jgi:hypothetical protein
VAHGDPVGIFTMYAVDNFRMFIIAWAAAGIAAAVVAQARTERGKYWLLTVMPLRLKPTSHRPGCASPLHSTGPPAGGHRPAS